LVASYLVEALLFRNERREGPRIQVIAAVRDPDAARERFAAYAGRSDLDIVHHDAGEPFRYGNTIDYVVHAAGNATPSSFGLDPIGTYTPNVIGTHHLLERAKGDGARGVLFLSSGAVHGALSPHSPPPGEDVYGVVDPLDARASYAESKRMGETICRSWWTQFGVPTRIARLSHTYGPGLRRTDERSFAQFVFCAVDGRDIALNSDGSAIRPFCYLADATVALLLVLLSGKAGEAYIVGNPSASCSIRELAELVAGMAPRAITVRQIAEPPPPSYLPNRDPIHSLNISKIRELGWRPTTTLHDGFKRTIETYL
jgi:nucleoside-diphosphate-sugar epimerase